ncbi:MAG: LPS-assembly protein LptD [Parvularculaceae bacterium]|nr:LPS-assembly protein LptD [Parvularculaceae bacterium]
MMLALSLLALGMSVTVEPEAPAAEAQEGDVLLTAERIVRNLDDGPIVAEGDVRASSNGQFLRADKVVYDRAADRVTAIGNVAVRDETGQLYFADEVILTSDLKSGVIESFRAALPPNGSLAAATLVRRESGNNELRRGVYSLCPVCDEGFRAGRPTWQVKANKVIQDSEAKRLRFQNAFLEIYGVPLIYIPYLVVPDPSVRRASGFLAPQIANSTRTGVEVEIPYYWAISDYQDLTFSPRDHSELGTLYKGQWRRNTWNSAANVQAGIIDPTNDLTEEPGNPDDIRWHWFSRYTRDLGRGWDLEADIDAVSDKGYLLTYDIAPFGELQDEINILRPDRLDSNVTFTHRTDNTFTDVTGYLFQTLRFNEDQSFTAQALPRIRHRRFYDWLGGQAELGGSFLSLQREDGLDSLRLSAHADYSATKLTRSGHRFETFAQLRGDVYRYTDAMSGTQACNVEDSFYEACRASLPRDLEEDEFSVSRLLPTIGAEWSFPLARVGQNTSFIIEPRIQAVISPEQDDTNRVFNEDSQFFQFDQVTLFDFNKSSGLDAWEDGQRLNMGISSTASFGQRFTVDAMIGAQIRSTETDVFGEDAGIGGEQSDYVGALDLRVGRNLVMDNRFRIDKDTGAFRRVENALRGKLGPISGTLNYLRIESDEEFGDAQRLDEFLILGTNINLRRGVSLAATQAQNLDSGSTTNTQVALRIANRCGAISFRYRFDDSTIAGFEQNRSLLVKFDVLGFN